MKKILLAFDGTQFSEGAFAFARRLNELRPVLLTGVFMPQMTYTNLWSYTHAMSGLAFAAPNQTQEAENVQQNIERFERLCRENGIACRVHKDYFDFALPELKKETRFADVLILSGEKFYGNTAGEDAMDYLIEALKEAECPVIVVPEHFIFPQRNILAYDGSASSVYAIKQFAYLFPELCGHETLLVYVKEDTGAAFPEQHNIEELATQHFKNLTLTKLDINPKKFFYEWIKGNADALLVTGSFGRSSLSQLVRKSFVSRVIADHQLPVFIAHK